MTPTAPQGLVDLSDLRAKAEADALAHEMFRARWPGKSWSGCDVSRSYWRRKARAMLAAAEGGEDG